MEVVYYLLYDLTVQIGQGIWWTIQLWLGTTTVAGIAGCSLSYLLVPPLPG